MILKTNKSKGIIWGCSQNFGLIQAGWAIFWGTWCGWNGGACRKWSKCEMSLKTERDKGRHKGLEPKIWIPQSRMSLYCVQHGQHREGCGDAFMMEWELGKVNTILCATWTTQSRVWGLESPRRQNWPWHQTPTVWRCFDIKTRTRFFWSCCEPFEHAFWVLGF